MFLSWTRRLVWRQLIWTWPFKLVDPPERKGALCWSVCCLLWTWQFKLVDTLKPKCLSVIGLIRTCLLKFVDPLEYKWTVRTLIIRTSSDHSSLWTFLLYSHFVSGTCTVSVSRFLFYHWIWRFLISYIFIYQCLWGIFVTVFYLNIDYEMTTYWKNDLSIE